MLHSSGGVVYRPALEIPRAKLGELIREFELVEDGEYLVDPTCLHRPLAEIVVQVERRLRRRGAMSADEVRRARDDLPRAYALAALQTRGLVVRTDNGGLAYRRGPYRD